MNTNSFYELGRYLYLVYRMEDLAVQGNENTVAHEVFDINPHYYPVDKRYLDGTVNMTMPPLKALHEAQDRYAVAFKSHRNNTGKNWGSGARQFIHNAAGGTLLDIDENDLSDTETPSQEEMLDLIQGFNKEVEEHDEFMNGTSSAPSKTSTKTATRSVSYSYTHQENPEFVALSEFRQEVFLALYEMKEVLRQSTFEDEALLEAAGMSQSNSLKGAVTQALLALDTEGFVSYTKGESFDSATVLADVGNPYAYDQLNTVETDLKRSEVSALRFFYQRGDFNTRISISTTELSDRLGFSRGGHVSEILMSLEEANWIRRDTSTSPYTYVPVQTRQRFHKNFGSKITADELSTTEAKVAALKSFFQELDRDQPQNTDIASLIDEQMDSVDDAIDRLSKRGLVDSSTGEVLVPVELDGYSVPVSLNELKNFI